MSASTEMQYAPCTESARGAGLFRIKKKTPSTQGLRTKRRRRTAKWFHLALQLHLCGDRRAEARIIDAVRHVSTITSPRNCTKGFEGSSERLEGVLPTTHVTIPKTKHSTSEAAMQQVILATREIALATDSRLLLRVSFHLHHAVVSSQL
jgi:hypothetical protein